MKLIKYYLGCSLLLASTSAFSNQTLILNSAFSEPYTNTEHTGVLDTIFEEIGKRTQLKILLQVIPAERALLNADQGIEDGDACRISGLEKNYPNLARTDESVMGFNMTAFTLDGRIKLNGIESLTPYHVGYLIGWKILEQKITNTRELSKFASDTELIASLLDKKIDIAVTEKNEGLYHIKKFPALKMITPTLYHNSCYLYLNRKHHHLLPQINTALKKMKRDGSYKRITDETLKKFLNGKTS